MIVVMTSEMNNSVLNFSSVPKLAAELTPSIKCSSLETYILIFCFSLERRGEGFDVRKFEICHSKHRCLVTKFSQHRKEHLMEPRIYNFSLGISLLPTLIWSQDGL